MDIEDSDDLRLGWINECQNIATEREVALVEELDTEARHGGLRDEAALIVVDGEVLARINDREELGALNNH